MKTGLLLTVLMTPLFSMAASEEKICEQIREQAMSNCAEIMCEDSLRQDHVPVTPKNIDLCISGSDGDLWEGAQICASEGEEEQLIKEYNSTHKKQINCSLE